MQRIEGLLKTTAWCSKVVYWSNRICLIFIELLAIDAVPPPFLPLLKENVKLKFGGEASVRITGTSVHSHVSVKNKQSTLLSKIRSLIIKDLFKTVHFYILVHWKVPCWWWQVIYKLYVWIIDVLGEIWGYLSSQSGHCGICFAHAEWWCTDPTFLIPIPIPISGFCILLDSRYQSDTIVEFTNCIPHYVKGFRFDLNIWNKS